MNPEEIPFDGAQAAAELIGRCRRTRAQWNQVYSTIGVEFQYREPTADEYILAINIVTRAARVAKQEKKK